jgi:hypothetical protein
VTHALPQNMEHSSGTSISPSAPRPLPNLKGKQGTNSSKHDVSAASSGKGSILVTDRCQDQ